MKPKLAFPLVALVTSAVAPSLIAGSDPSVPVGKLTASPTAVQAGTYPTLTWDITYPSEIKSGQDNSDSTSGGTSSGGTTTTGDSSSTAGTTTTGDSSSTTGSTTTTGDSSSTTGTTTTGTTTGSTTTTGDGSSTTGGTTASSDSTTSSGSSISSSSSSSSDSSGVVAAGYTTAPGQITLSDDYTVEVQIVGAGVTTCANGGAASTNSYPVDARLSVNGGSYIQLFYGTPSVVNPTKVLYSKKLKKGQTLNFGGRYEVNSTWTSFYTTKSAHQQIVSLVNGDVPPTTFALEKSATLASYVKPYLTSSGKITLGPLNVLVMMELGQTDHTQSCFDHQDVVLLVTLIGKSNNGHGNNLDGVDSSNPGQGHGGPNGGVDPSAGVDDEAK